MSHPFIRTTRSAVDVRNGRRDWFRIQNATSAEAEIFIYDEIGFFGITAKDFRDELATVTAPRVALHINSPGGDVFDAVAIYNAIRTHPADVTAYVDSLAASAASFIALAADKVVMAKHSQMMIHDAWGMAVGNADDMRKMSDFLAKQTDIIAAIYAERAGKDVAHWRGLMAEETWFSDEEAVAAGLAHEVGAAVAVKNTFDLSVFRRVPINDGSHGSEEPVEEAQPDGWQAEALLAIAEAELEIAHANAQ